MPSKIVTKKKAATPKKSSVFASIGLVPRPAAAQKPAQSARDVSQVPSVQAAQQMGANTNLQDDPNGPGLDDNKTLMGLLLIGGLLYFFAG